MAYILRFAKSEKHWHTAHPWRPGQWRARRRRKRNGVWPRRRRDVAVHVVVPLVVVLLKRELHHPVRELRVLHRRHMHHAERLTCPALFTVAHANNLPDADVDGFER